MRLQLPGEKIWSRGVCEGKVGPRSYELSVNGTRYRRNRRHIIPTQELPVMSSTAELDGQEAASDQPVQVAPNQGEQGAASPPEQSPPHDSGRAVEPPGPELPMKRSERVRRPPYWTKDYVMSQS